MTDHRDPRLQALFAEPQQELAGEAFVTSVMNRTRFLKYRVTIPIIGALLVAAVAAWFFAIPLELVQFVSQGLAITLVDLGDGWMGWMVSPVNNPASLAVLSVKAIRIARKKILAASYVN